VQVSIIRPGPIVGKMMHPYMRRQKQEKVSYPHPSLEATLKRTLGGLVSFGATGYYHATKYAVEGISESLAIEVKPLGI
jgi:NAD(P)-dependent dehydrogenase (short-subunit alcohol dehydrogenase family)